MAVVFDPHQKQPGNKITGEPGTVIGTKYRMLVPKNGPFYTGSLVVKSGGKILKLAGDYVITHPYMTAMQRTGRSAHGMIWIVNDKYTKDFTVDYHAIGLGGASSAQVTAERARNSDVYPSECQWEQVIGDVYFPPVDIQFDWDNWKGERELMLAIGEIGKKMTQIIKLPNPLSKNLGTIRFLNGSTAVNNENTWDYNGAGKFVYKDTVSRGYTLIWLTKPGGGQYSEYSLDFVNPYATADANSKWLNRVMIAGLAGSTYLYVQTSSRDIRLSLIMNQGSGSSTFEAVITNDLTLEALRAGVRMQIKRNPGFSTFDMTFTYGGKVFKYQLDLDNPPAGLLPGYTIRDVASDLKRPYTVQMEFWQSTGDSFTMLESPGAPEGDVADDMYSILLRYHQLVDSLYRNSPAIAHVADKNNPHGDDSYGRMRAIETNGIASDATLVYGKTQPQLSDYVNGLSAKSSDFTDKMLRSGADRTITGTFTMLPGLSSVTSSKDGESNGVGTNLQVDDKAIRLISRDSSTINAGNNPITFKAGGNSLVLYPDSRGLQWNNKIILDPTTVSQYLPGNSGGGDGIYYGKNSDSVTITGNGIETQPFICTWVPPSDTNVATLAMRMLTNDFGTSESLAATPALIQKLANEFTGKLEKSRAYINGLSLATSITLDKYTFNLGNVENTADADLPVSDLQATEFAKYSAVGHTHTADAFGIGPATTAKAGTVKFGGLVNDSTLALDGSYVVQQLKDVTSLEADAKRSDASSIIDILRFGTAGSDGVADGATFTGWMVTIKANNYFVGVDYAVPLATFNLTELFPGAYKETNFGIFVDIVDNAAKYVIKDKSNLAENSTMTRIGDILTDEDSIESAAIRNVTRLGDFRELTDHGENINAHTPRTMTQEQFGYTYLPTGPAWVNGGAGMSRGLADFRAYGPNSVLSPGGMDVDGNVVYFPRANTAAASSVWMIHMAKCESIGDLKLRFNPTDADVPGGADLVLAQWADGNTVHRLGFNISSGGTLTLSGKRSYVGFTLNRGSSKPGFSFGLDAGEYLVAVTDPNMKASATYSMLRDDTQGLYFQGTITVAGISMSYKLTLKGKPTLTVTRTDTNATQTVDLTSRFTAAGVDVSGIATDSTIAVHHGFGGAFNGEYGIQAVYDESKFRLDARYETAIDIINNISELGRIRTVSVEGSTTKSAQDLEAVVFASASKRAEGVPDYCLYKRMATYYFAGKSMGVIFRD